MSELQDVRVTEKWLEDKSLQELFDILCADNGEARVAGGAVRNALMGSAISDIDLCTTLLPGEVVERLEAAGAKAVPTGIEHGTVTAVLDGKGFEVTTLRKDIETNGRHAVVEFGTDWEADANRRDLTINGLYCDREGRIYDYVDGYRDILNKEIRFIGNAEMRIREDALRILRFFRFFAWYGEGRPDASGLKACAAGKSLLAGLSVERVWMELRKLLSAPDPGRAILWMRTTGILSVVLPESDKWGTDAIPGLLRLEHEQDWAPDGLFRLMGMVRPDSDTVKALAKRLSFSRKETSRLVFWAESRAPNFDLPGIELEKLLYQGDEQGLIDAMKLEVVHLRARENEAGANSMLQLTAYAEKWKRPSFPVQGKDLIGAGLKAGPEMGEKLKTLEEAWIDSGFHLEKQSLLDMI